jgi:hypothetical protein
MASPGNDETDHASNVDNPMAEAAPTPAPASPPAARPARPARSFLSRLLFSSLIMLVLLGVAGYGALVFRDADPRVNLAATYVDEGLKEAQSVLDKAQSSVAGLVGEAPKPTNAKVTTHRIGTLAPPGSEPVDKAPEPVAPEAAKESEKPVSPAPAAEAVMEPPRKPVEIAQEPAPSEALVAFAEKGAPTGARLREIFLPIAKKLKALEPRSEASHEENLTEHLLHGASKLVKVRPTGQAQLETLEGKIELIESALTHGNFAGAEKLIDNLPEAAKAETAEFAVTLHRRVEAEKAAEELLRGAIASIGAKK